MELNIVLVEPEIPPNTGNIVRTCAATGARLHIVRPMGFSDDNKHLKRAGLDYWHLMDLTFYDSLDDFFEKTAGGKYYYFSSKARRNYTQVGYPDGCYIVFRDLDFESGAEGFRVNAASATEGGDIEIRLDSSDGELIGKCPVSGTDGWDEYVELTCKTKLCTGTHDVYLVFTGGDGYLFNVNDFSFYGIKGDINGDRRVDVFDMIRYRKALTEEIKLTGLGLSNADMNADKETGIADALLLQKFLLGKTA